MKDWPLSPDPGPSRRIFLSPPEAKSPFPPAGPRNPAPQIKMLARASHPATHAPCPATRSPCTQACAESGFFWRREAAGSNSRILPFIFPGILKGMWEQPQVW